MANTLGALGTIAGAGLEAYAIVKSPIKGVFTYSFADISATINGPNGNFSIGAGAGVAEEGIGTEQLDETVTQWLGCDGSVLTGLNNSRRARLTIRLLKTSTTNAALSAMLERDRSNASQFGQNNIAMKQGTTGDAITFTGCAFEKLPSLIYAKDGGLVEWKFVAESSYVVLGNASLPPQFSIGLPFVGSVGGSLP